MCVQHLFWVRSQLIPTIATNTLYVQYIYYRKLFALDIQSQQKKGMIMLAAADCN